MQRHGLKLEQECRKHWVGPEVDLKYQDYQIMEEKQALLGIDI